MHRIATFSCVWTLEINFECLLHFLSPHQASTAEFMSINDSPHAKITRRWSCVARPAESRCGTLEILVVSQSCHSAHALKAAEGVLERIRANSSHSRWILGWAGPRRGLVDGVGGSMAQALKAFIVKAVFRCSAYEVVAVWKLVVSAGSSGHLLSLWQVRRQDEEGRKQRQNGLDANASSHF